MSPPYVLVAVLLVAVVPANVEGANKITTGNEQKTHDKMQNNLMLKDDTNTPCRPAS